MATNQQQFDQVSVIGGRDLPDDQSQANDVIDVNAPTDDLGRRLYALLRLHPDVDLNFRQDDISAMDDATKQILISDIQTILNVPPFKSGQL